MKKIILFSMVFATVMLGCKKEDDDETASPSKSAMLSGTWKMTAFTVDPPLDILGTPISDLYNSIFYPECVKDNLYVFMSDKSYEINEGTSKCDDSDPQVIETGTWAFNSDQTVIVVTPSGGSSEELTYESLTSKTLVVKFTEVDSSTATLHTYKQTLTKQ